MNETFYAYIAGMIDADGHIGTGRNRYKVTIANNYLPMLEHIQFHVGGHISEDDRGRIKTYQLNFRVHEQIELLPRIIPYLIVKKQKAIERLKYLKANNDYRYRTMRDNKAQLRLEL